MPQRKIIPAVLGVIAALAMVSCTVPPTTTEPSSPSAHESKLAPSSPAPLADLTPQMLKSAKIPSMCGFPAGKLVDGALPAKHPEYPNASAPTLADSKLTVAADLTGNGVKELVTAFYCDKGGVAWPAHIQLFQSTAQGIAPLGKPFQIGDVNGGARGIPSSLKVDGKKLVIADRELLTTEPAAAPSGQIKATLAWNGKQLVAESIEDLAATDRGILDLSLVNGTWCPGDDVTAEHSPGCLEIKYPQVTHANGDVAVLNFWVNNGFTTLNYSDAPLAMFYAPGTKIADPANPNVPTGHLNEVRMYNNQTQGFYLREAK